MHVDSLKTALLWSSLLLKELHLSCPHGRCEEGLFSQAITTTQNVRLYCNAFNTTDTQQQTLFNEIKSHTRILFKNEWSLSHLKCKLKLKSKVCCLYLSHSQLKLKVITKLTDSRVAAHLTCPWGPLYPGWRCVLASLCWQMLTLMTQMKLRCSTDGDFGQPQTPSCLSHWYF